MKRAKVTVKPAILDKYSGVYALPSGALLRVFREQNRLMAGTPPYELLPQTSRRFASNRNPAVITFERNDDDQVNRLNFQVAKRDLWIERVDESKAVDPTIMIDAGGHRLRMLITGEGGPAVVIEDGFGSSIEARSELQAMLSAFTCVVAYDHAGTGGSQPGPPPRDARRIAIELRTALKNAAVEPPYILVGGSIGGDYIRVFAQAYPAEVAGLVLLDPTPDWDALQHWLSANSPQQAKAFRRMHALARQTAAEMMKYQEPGRRQEWAAIDQTRAQASEAFPSSKILVTQIIGAAGRERHVVAADKVKFFQSWLKRHIPHGKQVVAEKSGHAIFAAEPELVVREIRRLVLQRQTITRRRPL